ncbi:MAG: thiamine pyrophosphate-binding protein [Planctomycetaceae bacterium]
MAVKRKATDPVKSEQRPAPLRLGEYLIQRLQESGVRDVFGIPGDFVLQFYGMLESSPLRVIGTTSEACAGYAADGYARINGIGCVCVTYCVGGLSLCNAVAGAYAEKSPVIVISGAPGMSERRTDPLLHHRVRDFHTQKDVFEKITIASASLEDELTAAVDAILTVTPDALQTNFGEACRGATQRARCLSTDMLGNKVRRGRHQRG